MNFSKVLIVEDDLLFQLKIRKVIEEMGCFQITTVITIEEATTHLSDPSYDLLICDIVLQGGVAFDIKTFPDIPTIFVTAHDSKHFLEKSLEVKNAFFLVKPFSELSLIATITRATEFAGPSSNETITVFGKHKNPIEIPVWDIEYVEAIGNYSYIVKTDGNRYAVKKSAKLVMESLNGAHFVRIMRSTFVNKSKIVRVSILQCLVHTAHHEFKVARNFKKSLYEFHNLNT